MFPPKYLYVGRFLQHLSNYKLYQANLIHRHHKEWKNLSHIFLAKQDCPDSCKMCDEVLPVECNEMKLNENTITFFCLYEYTVYSLILEFEIIHLGHYHLKTLSLRFDVYNQLHHHLNSSSESSNEMLCSVRLFFAIMKFWILNCMQRSKS